MFKVVYRAHVNHGVFTFSVLVFNAVRFTFNVVSQQMHIFLGYDVLCCA